MIHTQKFIEDAIKGGWNTTHVSIKKNVYIEKYLLDPSAWKTVGKVREWGEEKEIYSADTADGDESLIGGVYLYPWQYKMHVFLDLLIEGKSIEDALSEIE